MSAPLRIKKIDELLKRELGKIIQKEVEFDKEIFFTITRVVSNNSLQAARVYFMTFPSEHEAYALSVLNRNIMRIQSMLNRTLRTRPIPKIRFAVDDMEERAQELEETMATLKHNEETHAED